MIGTTTSRVGVDIVGVDKTGAAFASAINGLSRFERSMKSVNKAFGALSAGFLGGAVLQNFVRSLVDVSKHNDKVKASFTTLDRAWQAFAVNVGKAGLNDGLAKFNDAMSKAMVGMDSLATAIGKFLGGVARELAAFFEGIARTVAFLSVNLPKISAAIESFTGIDLGGRKQIFDFSEDLKFLEKLGLDVSMFKGEADGLDGKLKNLGLTFAEQDELTKKLTERQKKLEQTYRSGISSLQDYSNGLMLQAQTFGMGDAAASRFSKKYEFLTKMQREGVKLTAAQTAEMTKWLDVIFASSVQLDQQMKSFQKFEELKQKVADTFQGVADIFKDSFATAFDSIIDKTASVSDAFRTMAMNMLRQVAALFANQAFQQLIGGYTSGSNGISGIGTGLIGKLIGGLFPTSGMPTGGSLYGFAGGGAFRVGGSGGTDSQVVGFKASPNETVRITTPSQEAARGSISVTINNQHPNGKAEVGHDSDGKLVIFFREMMRNEFPGMLKSNLGTSYAMKPNNRRR